MKKIIVLMGTFSILCSLFTPATSFAEKIPWWERVTLRFTGTYNYYKMQEINDNSESLNFNEWLVYTDGSGEYRFSYNFKDIEKDYGFCIDLSYSLESAGDFLECAFGYERLEADSKMKTPLGGVTYSDTYPVEGLYLALPINIFRWDIEDHYKHKKVTQTSALIWTKQKKSVNWDIFWKNMNPDWKLSICPSVGYYRLENAGFDYQYEMYEKDGTPTYPYVISATNFDVTAKDEIGSKIELRSEWLFYDYLVLGIGVGYRWLKFTDTTWTLAETGWSGKFYELDYTGHFYSATVGLKF